MSEPIGPGDVVEAVDPFGVRRWPHGLRFTVLEVFGPTSECSCASRGTLSHQEPHGGLGLWEIPGRWCIYDFRKIGGSRADTMRQFSEVLNTKAPAPLEPVSA